MTHERVKDVGTQSIEDAELLGQDAPLVNMLVLHQGISADIVTLHGNVKDSMRISKMTKEQQSTRHGGGEVEDEVRDHDHIRLMADNLSSLSNIRLPKGLVEKRMENGRAIIDRQEDRWLKLGAVGVAGCFQGGNATVISLLCPVVNCFVVA